MIVVPEIGSSERFAHGTRLQLKIPAELAYFEGHFPGCPLLPGVVQVGWAIELGRQQLAVQGTFRSLSAVKFMRVIQPGEAVSLLLEYASEKHQLDFAYELDGRTCSSGTALFDP